MSKQKREPTPITRAMKNRKLPTNPQFYAKQHNFNMDSMYAVTGGKRFNKEIIIQLLVDGYVKEVIETFKGGGC